MKLRQHSSVRGAAGPSPRSRRRSSNSTSGPDAPGQEQPPKGGPILSPDGELPADLADLATLTEQATAYAQPSLTDEQITNHQVPGDVLDLPFRDPGTASQMDMPVGTDHLFQPDAFLAPATGLTAGLAGSLPPELLSVSDMTPLASDSGGSDQLEMPWDFLPVGGQSDDESVNAGQTVQNIGGALVHVANGHHSPNGWIQPRTRSLSPFLPNQAVAAASTSQLISSGLLQIYHDVLENNLTCWLSEETCPYTSQELVVHSAHSRDSKKQRGSSWSNRMYERTIQLDRVAMANGMVQITRSESRAAAAALNLAIMAFAAQWAQGSERSKETYPATYAMGKGGMDATGTGGTEEFDRKIQRQLWEQARKALQEVSDVECFRVVSAETIFGLTQRPFDGGPYPADPDGLGFLSESITVQGLKTRLLARIHALIATEGPPIYVERAARKMQALKSRFDESQRGSASHAPGRESFSQENQSTIDLLYWLTVMFDTISSSMNYRPVSVSDEESRHLASPQDDATAAFTTSTTEGPAVGRWHIESFIQDNVFEPQKAPVWPCSYEEASDAVVRSAPVKVLLFRYISYLQTLIRKGVRGTSIDDMIDSTIRVYEYWEMTYGAFFRALVRDIHLIPLRIQGWFACISGHWHLAALMLAELIDEIDGRDLGTSFSAQYRISMKTAEAIRDTSVRDLSDLARISTIRKNDQTTYVGTTQQLKFHHAVNDCVILTEPWTIILIRAFTKASTILLGEVEQSINEACQRPTWSEEGLSGKLKMAEHCISALWNLGKKSDLSRKSADILLVALNRMYLYIGENGC